jgi:hypothetical protein
MTCQGKRLDLKRSKAVTSDRIKALFEVIKGPLLAEIRPQHCYNMDETGIMEGIGSNGKVFVSKPLPGSKKKR